VVRFVNIIGTRGSVIETFTDQVLGEQPLTVTDERMTRYWISMHEALWSLLSGPHAAPGGSLVMPECGEAVPLLETARRLAGWYQPERVPYPIAATGIRPGERLHEVLLSANETFARSRYAGLRLVRSERDPRRLQELPAVVDELRALMAAHDQPALRARALTAAHALQ
jgi:FlaA1/EpsC-like NDP-sugar epimerase